MRPFVLFRLQSPNTGFQFLLLAACLFFSFTAPAIAADGNHLSYLHSNEVWYPHQDFPKLITPQWVGEDGVDCVITLAIDDMRDTAKYEAYLRPILQRLKQIDGRAPVSIMTCAVKPDDPQLQSWLQEGLSLECHTIDHPCPILAGSDIKRAKATYDKCVDLMHSIPNNIPVAFRTPCCDSLNTVSPRLFSEITNKTTPNGNFLQLDSSVFTLYTADDPTIPRHLLFDPDGQEKFRKYIPRKLPRGNLVHDGFVNSIENYPYPYLVQQSCWEFPCMVPSDWSANHLHQPNNPNTIRDLKAALDITVHKQGVFNLVFHPHGWIKAEQVIELIDHAVTKHSKKVKFLTFKECVQRLNLNLLEGDPIRVGPGRNIKTCIIDVNGDGNMDIVRARENDTRVRAWDSTHKRWRDGDSREVNLVRMALQREIVDSVRRPLPPAIEDLTQKNESSLKFVDINDDGHSDVVFSGNDRCGCWLFDPVTRAYGIEILHQRRGTDSDFEIELPPFVREDGTDNGFFVKDRHLCWINEDTDNLPDFILRVAFDKLIGDRLPEAKSPEAATRSMRVASGYRADLVAHEPLTMDPVAMDWGPEGKLWIAEMADYPRGIDDKGKPGGRIRYLEDANGDGIYDKSTLFLEDVPFPNGVLSWKKGVLVSAAPDVFYAEDTDGDGKADVKQVLFTGFSEGNQQHRANGFARGLDNWLYLANGDSGGTVRVVSSLRKSRDRSERPAEQVTTVDIRGRDIRLRPDTGEIETVAGQSQFGRNRDDWGNWFGNNNSRPMWHYVLDDHYLRRNAFLIAPNVQKDVSIAPGPSTVFPSSRTLTRFNDFHTANRFTSACSSMVYRDQLIGKELPEGSAQVFISEPVHNLVHREIMRPDGISFTSQRAVTEEQSEFLSSTDNWFRPTQLKTGPDGALYVADMYRLVIEHPQWIPVEWQRKLDLRAGHDKGRVWRVAPVDTKLRIAPRLDRMTTAELVAALNTSNGWQRDMAQQLIIDGADAAAIPLLAKQVKERPAVPSTQYSGLSTEALCRLHSLCTLDGLSELETIGEQARKTLDEVLPIALADPHPGVRRHAIRLCEVFPEPSEATWNALTRLVEDPDPQVQLQLAYTLGEIKYPQAGSVLGWLALRSNGNSQFTAAVLSSMNSGNLEAVLAEVTKYGSDQTDLLQQLLGQATAFNHEKALVVLLMRATQPAAPTSIDNTVARELHPLPGGFSGWQYSAVEQLLVSLERRFMSLDQWLKGLSTESQPIVDRLQILFSAARKLALNEEIAPKDRILAVRVLGRTADSKEDVAVLTELITPRQPPVLQSASLATLAHSKSPEIAKTLLASYRSLAPSLRSQTCDILLSREAWRDELLTALEAKQISPTDLDAGTRQRLLEQKSKSIAERAAKVLAVDLNSDRAKIVAEYLPLVRTGGDAQHGSQLFKKMCSQCHKLADVGHSVGPDLVSLTDKSTDALITAVLDPNRAVETKFLTFTAITKAGVTHSGLLASETAGSVTLRAAEGKEVTLLRNEIDELQSSTKSLMPEGLERDLKPADAASLLAYIRLNVPHPAMKSFPGNEPRVVNADLDGKFTLTPMEAEIYGPTIIIEEKYKNLGWWSSADDFVVWTINVPKAGVYTFNWTYACEPSSAGRSLVVDAVGKSLTRRVEATESWDDYRSQSLGELELPAGEVRVTLKPAARPLPALADVKSLLLSPKK